MVDFTYNMEERAEWVARFNEQLERIQGDLFEGERIEQCLDTDSANGQFYNPQWVITSEARVWSLAKNNNHGGWNRPYLHETTHRWNMRNDWHETKERLGLAAEKKILYHQMVANYFLPRPHCYNETWVAHHVFGYYHLYDLEVLHDTPELRFVDCRWINRVNHLYWVNDSDHNLISFIQKNTDPIDITIEKLKKGITYRGQERGLKISIDDQMTEEIIKALVENGRFVSGERKLWNAIAVEYKDDGRAHYYVEASFTGNEPPYL